MHVCINTVACSSMVSKPLVLFELVLKRIVEMKKFRKSVVVLPTNLYMPRLNAVWGVHEPIFVLSWSVRRFYVIIIAMFHVFWTVHVQAMLVVMLWTCYSDHRILHYMRAKWFFTVLCKAYVFLVVWWLHTIVRIHSTVKLVVINHHTLITSWQIYQIQLYCKWGEPEWAPH